MARDIFIGAAGHFVEAAPNETVQIRVYRPDDMVRLWLRPNPRGRYSTLVRLTPYQARLLARRLERAVKGAKRGA